MDAETQAHLDELGASIRALTPARTKARGAARRLRRHVMEAPPELFERPEFAALAAMREEQPRPTSVYRWFDGDGALLYVGITGNVWNRTKNHDAEKPWWQQVASATVEHFETRVAALIAEAVAIRTESPRYNVAGKPAADSIEQRLIEFIVGLDPSDAADAILAEFDVTPKAAGC